MSAASLQDISLDVLEALHLEDELSAETPDSAGSHLAASSKAPAQPGIAPSSQKGASPTTGLKGKGCKMSCAGFWKCQVGQACWDALRRSAGGPEGWSPSLPTLSYSIEEGGGETTAVVSHAFHMRNVEVVLERS